MENTVLYALPITYVILFVIVLLHIVGAILPLEAGKRKSNIILYALMGVNLLLHVGLFVLSIVKSAPANEMLLALMISAAVGSLAIGLKKKS